ncbi:hypothetical protein CSKR_106714 [Clonorchis sinensis]|uniref:Uncharacterized protein n=1 Tax=Clonorchis sinensis TaxID=79923 RepID=A0A3R7FMU8_CLOSI|nr:hypothetical protein CSKR_106714 [Clonorchis sinensis]
MKMLDEACGHSGMFCSGYQNHIHVHDPLGNIVFGFIKSTIFQWSVVTGRKMCHNRQTRVLRCEFSKNNALYFECVERMQQQGTIIIIKDSNISVDTDASLPYNHKAGILVSDYFTDKRSPRTSRTNQVEQLADVSNMWAKSVQTQAPGPPGCVLKHARRSFGLEMAQWLTCKLTDQKVIGSNPISASRPPLSGLRQLASTSGLVLSSGDRAARHRKGVIDGQFLDAPSYTGWKPIRQLRSISGQTLQRLQPCTGTTLTPSWKRSSTDGSQTCRRLLHTLVSGRSLVNAVLALL